MKTLVLIVVRLLHAISVVNMVMLRLFVFAKLVFLLVMLKPQNFLLLEKSAHNSLGHTVDTCYKKHGFPLSYKFTNWTS